MNRAYSLLTVKAVDDDARVIEGVATTPSPDRVGDIVEPLGVKFTNPLPLLHQHQSAAPVGTVTFRKPTADGIRFIANLPHIAEPGPLQQRVDTAWGEVKAGLVRGVSIGFRPLEQSYMDDGGIRFIASEVLELSLVTIPANADATIQTIKSVDGELLAALGHGQTAATSGPASGAPGNPPTKPMPRVGGTSVKLRLHGAQRMPKSISEQIADFGNTRAEKATRMLAIMEKAGDSGETLDEAQQQEYDGLDGELKAIDEHLERLRTAEQLSAAQAKAVDGGSAAKGTASRGAPVVTAMRRQLPPGIGFARYAKCLMAANGAPGAALQIAEHHYPDMDDLHIVLRAAVAAGTTTDATWASALVQYQNLAGEFLEFLRPSTIVGKFGMGGIPSLRAVPFNVRIPKQTGGGDAYWVGEGAAKPLTQFAFDTVTLRWAKCANIAVITEELARFSSPAAEELVRNGLRDALVARIDLTFVDPAITAIADTRPASITNGISATATSGTDSAAARADVQALFGKFIANNLSPAGSVWIMNATTALTLSMMRNALDQPEFPDITMNGGTYFGLPVITSQHMAAAGAPATSNIILVNAGDILLADDGTVTIDASREASLQMDSAPTQSSGSPPVATQSVSMFQTNSIAIRAERYINWDRARDTAVEYLSGVAYVA